MECLQGQGSAPIVTKEYLKTRIWNQSQLAKAIHSSQSRVAKLEKGNPQFCYNWLQCEYMEGGYPDKHVPFFIESRVIKPTGNRHAPGDVGDDRLIRPDIQLQFNHGTLESWIPGHS